MFWHMPEAVSEDEKGLLKTGAIYALFSTQREEKVPAKEKKKHIWKETVNRYDQEVN